MNEVGVIQYTPPSPKQQPNIVECCDDVEVDPVNGCYVCVGCGLVKDHYFSSTEEEHHYPKPGESLGGQSSYLYEKRRFYIPLTHFQEHLRRYLGARFTQIPVKLLDDLRAMKVNVKDINAFQLVKHGLKKLKNNNYTVTVSKPFHGTSYVKHTEKQVKSVKLYKEIFTIIYLLGGHKPIFTQVEEIKQLYKDFCFFYMKRKKAFNRKNMPSNYMLLDLLLKELDHQPYYNIPYLKNEELKQEILDIFQLLKLDKNKCLQYP